jgi:hypothetical protein
MLNVRFGAAPLFTAGSGSTSGSATPSPVPTSGDPIEPGGHDQGRTPPAGSNRLFADSFEQATKKK